VSLIDSTIRHIRRLILCYFIHVVNFTGVQTYSVAHRHNVEYLYNSVLFNDYSECGYQGGLDIYILIGGYLYFETYMFTYH